MRGCFIIWVLVLAGAGMASGQPNSYPFKRISVEEGLSQSTVNAIAQDLQGFLWFGTQDGLNRYDGYRFVVFQHDARDPGSLSSNWVSALHVDRAGRLWIGTHGGGLNRFVPGSAEGAAGSTGRQGQFIRYRHDPDDPNSLADNIVSDIYEDREGVLWIGTFGGVSRFDPFGYAPVDSAQGRQGRPPGKLPSATLPSTPLRAGGAGSSTSSLRLRSGQAGQAPTAGAFTNYRHDPDDPGSLSHNHALVLIEDGEGTLWVGTDQGGLDRFDRETERFTHYRHDPDDPNSISSDVILSLYTDRAGALWIGTANAGLNQLAPRASEAPTLPHGRFIRYEHDPGDPRSLSHNRVLAIHEGPDGALWVGTEGGGLNRLDPFSADPATGNFTAYRHDPADLHSLSSDVVTALHTDRSGTLWAGTAGGGLNKKGRFLHYQARSNENSGLSGNNILAAYETADGMLWVGTNGNGLNRYDPRTQRFTAYRHDSADPYSLGHDRVLGITEDRAGRLWISTGNGLSRLDRRTGRFTTYRSEPGNPNSLGDSRVFFAYEAPATPGVLWIGTWGGGLNRFDPQTGTFTRYRHDPDDPNSLSSDRVISIHQDRAGRLWVGTVGGGLNCFDPQTGAFTRYRHDPADPNSLSQDIVAAIYEDTSGRLWVGTSDGLNRFDPETGAFTRYTQRDGMPNNTVYGILEDEAGRLWLSTNKGLSAFDPFGYAQGGPLEGSPRLRSLRPGSGQAGQAGQAPDAGSFTNYDVGDGLQSNEFNQGAYHRSASGELFFGGINGLNRFYPGDLRASAAPPVVLTALGTGPSDPETLPPAGMHTLTLVEEDAFSVEFAALDFSNPAKNRYAYRLEGYDAEWHFRDADRRFVDYANLPGGTYTLRVRGANSDGLWNEEGYAMTVTVVPPFWETAWFRLLAALAGLGVLGSLGYAWHRVRIRRVERMRDERAEIQRRLAESREGERLHLAQELHDGAVQDLYGVQFQLGMFAEALPERDDRVALNQGQATVQTVIQQLRTICGELRPPVLAPFGLERAIRSHAERFEEQYPTLNVSLDLTPDGQTLPEPVRLALYRVYQEAMNNIVKHAGASNVAIRFALDAHRIALEIRDDGRGFVLPDRWLDLGRREHYGLLGIAERVDSLGGRLEVDSAPGRGTTVRVTLATPTRST